MEAVEAGAPVVASDVAGLEGYVAGGETALLVAPGDATALRDALDRLVGDRELAERLRPGGLAPRRALDGGRLPRRGRGAHLRRAPSRPVAGIASRRMRPPPSSSPFWKVFEVLTRVNVLSYRLTGGVVGGRSAGRASFCCTTVGPAAERSGSAR